MTSTLTRAKNHAKQVSKVDDCSADCCTPKVPDGKPGAGTDCRSDCECHCTSDGDIRILAYLKWEAAGCPQDLGLRFWLEAERELDARRPGAGSARG